MEHLSRSLSDRYLRNQRGFSLIEVILVVLIMGILAAVAAQKWGGALEQSRFDATRSEMDQLVTAIAGNEALVANGMRSDFGYVGDVGSLPPNLDALVANPGGFATWNGPYIQNDFTQNPNDFKQDAWGTNYTYAGGVIIASTGSGSTVTKQFASANADLTANSVVGSITDGLNNAPGDSAPSVTIRVDYPDGVGAMTSSSTNPSAGGSFTFASTVPIGNRVLTAIYQADTITRYVSVLPKSTAYVNFRFPGDLWSASGGGGGGGGGGSGSIIHVPGSATALNSGRDLTFDIQNTTGSPITITSIQASYGAPIYYEKIEWNGGQIFNQDNPRGGSGDTQALNKSIGAGSTVTIGISKFKQCQTGGCGSGSVSGQTFTITLSNGDLINFTVP